jgi:aldehyde dehydrogenase (NAD+)
LWVVLFKYSSIYYMVSSAGFTPLNDAGEIMIHAKSILEKYSLGSWHSGVCSHRHWLGSSKEASIASHSPIDGSLLATVGLASAAHYETVLSHAQKAFSQWRMVPAPTRGELVRRIGNELREHKEYLGALVSLESGKSLQEGKGEVQEMIDICDFAVGLSRQLYGFTMHSERPQHRMYEQWHPLGCVGIITAFNFPVAVWAWNTMLAVVCGNVTIWKPSEKTPLCAIACFKIIDSVLRQSDCPEGVFSLVVGDRQIGERLAADPRIDLVSATGSVAMGKAVGRTVGARLGKSLLELGGNNAIILSPHANLAIAIPSIVFGAVGTAGQRCTSTRRLIIHESIFPQVVAALTKAYSSLKIGSPLDEHHHVGPLIDVDAVTTMQKALREAERQGGKILFGGEVLQGSSFTSGCYVRPALVHARHEMPIVQEETFAPILYLLPYSGSLESAIALQNNVPQGLSSAIFTDNLQESELFLSHQGSDCGIANVNIGTSGAEIGGAFGGEKDTGGGRESGSDAWRAYMRRQTNTINFGSSLPLAQGIKFEW